MSGNITRIKNNQITDGTIQSAKLASGTLVGTNFAPTLTLNSNVTIIGNLSISGNTSSINSVNTYVQDPLVVFNNGYTGSVAGYDIGILVNRNLSSLGPYGAVNTAWVWVENDQAFESIATSTTGNALTGLTSVGFANLKTGNATMVSASITNNLTAGGITGTPISGSTGYFSTLYATNFSTANAVLSGGSITNDVITSSTGNFTTLQGTAFSTGNAVIAGGYISALANATITTGVVTNFSTANAVITGGSLNSTPIGATTASTGNFSTLQGTNFSTANAVVTGGSLNSTPIGATTASTGAFTTLSTSGVTTHNGNVVAASGTTSTNSITGALVVVGGTGISGNLNVAGLAAFTDAIPTTGPNTGALQVTSGGAYISGNLWVGGNINFTPNAISTISGNSAQFFGNAAGFGALFAGISSGYVIQPQTVLQASTNFNGYAQVNHQNINSGANASTDYVATADAGTATAGYIDMGINSSGFVGGAGNELNYPLDGYLYVNGTTSTNGNLLISTSQQADVVFSINGQGSANEVGRFQYNGGSSRLLLKTTTASTSTTTGALTVAGGAGIAGAVYAGSVFDNGTRVLSTSTGAGNLSISGTAVTLTATGPGATTVGSSTSVPVITTDAYGRISTLTSAAINTGFTLNGTSGTAAVTGGSTLSLAGTYGVTVTVGTEYANIATPQDLRTTASPTFTGLQATTLVATNFSSGNAVITGGSITGDASGNFTTLQGTNFSTANAVITGGTISGLTALNVTTETATNFASGNAVITGGSLNSTPIGATTASTGAFTTVTASSTVIATGNVVAAATTASTTTNTGALVVNGGVGIAGDVNVGGNLKVSGTLTYINTTTELVGGIEIVAGNLVANSGTASSSTSTGALVVVGGAGFSGTVNATAGVFGSLNNTIIGNVTPATGNFSTLQGTNFSTANAQITGGTISGLTALNVTTETATNFATANAVITGGTISGLTALNVTTETATNFASGNAVITGGSLNATPVGATTASTGAFTTLSSSTQATLATAVATNFSTGNAVIAGGYISSLANATITAGAVTTLVATNFSSGNAVITGGSITGDSSGSFTTLQGTNFSTANAVITGGRVDNTPVGAFTPSTGAFTTLSASGTTGLNTLTTSGVTVHNGNLVAASGTGSVSTTTGALVVTGGMGVTGNINIGNNTALHQITGNLLLGLGTAAASAVTTLEINQNVDVPQNSTSVVHISAKTGNTGKITLDSFGTGISSLLILRSAAGTSTTPTAVQNGAILAAFVGRGYGTTGYLLNSPNTSTGLVVSAAQNYTDTAQGSIISLNTTPLNSNVAVSALTINPAGTVTILANTASTGTLTGALVVSGGVGIAGNVNIGGALSVTGVPTFFSNIVASGGAASTSTTTGAITVNGGVGVTGQIYAGGIQATPIGATTASTGAFTTVTAGTTTTGGLQASVIGNVTPGSATFTTLQTNSTFTASGNLVAASGTASTTTTTGALVVVGGAGISGAVNIGGATTISTATVGGLQASVIGNVAPGSATFTTVQTNSTFTACGTVSALSGSSSTSTTTGALQVTGGAGVTGNIYVGGNAIVSGASIFNTSQTAGYDHIVKGASDSSLVWARPSSTYDQVLIGGSATTSTLVRGAKLQINSTDSILIPVGSNANRPSSTGGIDVAGMLRFSTTTNAVEWYNGTTWFSPTTAFTVIADQQFNGDGSTVAFTLNTAQTAASTIVSINGVVQIPTLAYGVSGTTLTFTEAPASGDIIDVRSLTTTVTVTSLSDSTGYNSVLVSSSGVQITTGTSQLNVISTYTPTGAIVNSNPNVTVATASVATTVDSFFANTYSSSEYTVTATIQGTNIRQIAKVLVVTDGTNAYVTPYAITSTSGNTLATFGGTVSGGSVNFQANVTNANTILRMNKQYQAI